MGRIDLSKRISLIVAATVVAGNLAFADVSKNCITDLKLSNDGGNVRVNIYTNKPYTDSVVVSKKEGNKYVILVPETTSNVKATPRVTGGGNVSVNMQTVSAGRGYTKITLTSDRAINVVPKTITYTPVSKPVAQTPKPAQQVKPVQAVKPAPVAKPVQTAKSVKPVKVAKPVSVAKPQPKVAKTTPVAKPQPKVVNQTPKPVSKPVQKVVQQPVQTPPVADVSRNKPLEILEQEVKTDKVSDIKESKPDALLEKTIKDNDEIIKQRKLKKRKNKRRYAPIIDTKLGAKECIKLVLEEAKTLSLWKLLMLASAISFPIIVIMVILGLDKRINKRINSMRKEDDVAAMERALKENVAAVRAQKAMQTSSQQEQQFNSFDELLDRVEDMPAMSEPYEDSLEPENLQEEQDFGDVDTSDFELEPSVPEIVDEDIAEACEPTLVDDTMSLDDFIQDNTLDSEPVGDFEEVAEVQPAEVVPFNPDGVLADFSNINDKEFFDELVLQSFAEKDVNNLPENTPADEIFGVMTEDDSGIMLSDFEHKNFEQEQAASDNIVDDSEDVTMLNEAKINDNTGLYLVNYDNFSSLVGHVKDDYFVIKKFDGIVNGNIILKQAEKVNDSTRYLVRVGRNKMIVEVNDKSMSRLIDL